MLWIFVHALGIDEDMVLRHPFAAEKAGGPAVTSFRVHLHIAEEARNRKFHLKTEVYQ